MCFIFISSNYITVACNESARFFRNPDMHNLWRYNLSDVTLLDIKCCGPISNWTILARFLEFTLDFQVNLFQRQSTIVLLPVTSRSTVLTNIFKILPSFIFGIRRTMPQDAWRCHRCPRQWRQRKVAFAAGQAEMLPGRAHLLPYCRNEADAGY